jgi:type 1 fimbria pilin
MAGKLFVPNNFDSFTPFVFDESLSPPRDMTAGTLQSRAFNYGMRVADVTCPIQKNMQVHGQLVPGMENVYQTNVPGIGVQFYTTSGWNGLWELAPSAYSYYPGAPTASVAWYARATLVVTGPVASGTLTVLPSMTVTFSGSCFATVSNTQTIAPGTRILPNTCTVTTPSVSVALPEVKASDLRRVGESRGDTRFRIGLQCSAGADVFITLTDATDPDNRSNLLTLTRDSTAQGVKLRMLNNGAPVSYGPDAAAKGTVNQWRVGPSAEVTGVPLSVQYVATGEVKPGTVQGNATFTMSYQ